MAGRGGSLFASVCSCHLWWLFRRRDGHCDACPPQSSASRWYSRHEQRQDAFGCGNKWRGHHHFYHGANHLVACSCAHAGRSYPWWLWWRALCPEIESGARASLCGRGGFHDVVHLFVEVSIKRTGGQRLKSLAVIGSITAGMGAKSLHVKDGLRDGLFFALCFGLRDQMGDFGIRTYRFNHDDVPRVEVGFRWPVPFFATLDENVFGLLRLRIRGAHHVVNLRHLRIIGSQTGKFAIKDLAVIQQHSLIRGGEFGKTLGAL